MASKDVADSTPAYSTGASSVASALPFDRMAALGKWIVAKVEEMNQLDARIERRLEHLQRSEESLRTLCESVRQQVVAAQDATGEFDAARARAAQQAASDRAAFQQIAQAPSPQEERLQNAMAMAAQLNELLDQKTAAIEKSADAIVQKTSNRLAELFRVAYEQRTTAVHDDFEQRSAQLVESIRRSAIEQVERLADQTAVAVEPVLARITRQQDQSEAQLRAAVETAENSLRHRAEQLCRAGDLAVDALEQRLARRVESVRPRTEQAISVAERSLQKTIAAMVGSARDQLNVAQADLVLQAQQLRPHLAELTQQAQDELVDHLARLEEHAFTMTGWLEQRMGQRVDELVQTTRTAMVASSGGATPIDSEDSSVFADEYASPTPKLKLSLYLDRRPRPVSSDALSRAS